MGGATLITYITAVTAAIEVFLLPVLFALATLFFLFGVFRYFIVPSASNEDHEQARRYIIWGLAGLVTLFIFWGIINLILQILGIDGISTYSEIDYLRMNGWGLPSNCSGSGSC